MKKFNEFNIKTPAKGFIGEKIKIFKVLDKEIEVHAFDLNDSKVYKEKGTKKCLSLQIKINGEFRIIFTGSIGLIEQTQQVPENEFPFVATIIKENDRYIFV